jgi:hypothetical protein
MDWAHGPGPLHVAPRPRCLAGAATRQSERALSLIKSGRHLHWQLRSEPGHPSHRWFLLYALLIRFGVPALDEFTGSNPDELILVTLRSSRSGD